MIVVDASLMTAWLLNESRLTEGFGMEEVLADFPAIVPSHWPLEVSNALRTNVRSGRLGPTDFHAIVDQIDSMTIQVQPSVDLDNIIPIAQFAAAHDLTAYDAAYVQLALDSGFMLATLDKAMRRAAIKLGVRVVPD